MKDDSNLKDLETYYDNMQAKQIEVETRLQQTKIDIENLLLLVDDDLINLKELQQINNSLKEKIFEFKKQEFMEKVNDVTFKNVIGLATPFFSKLKETVTNKTREVKEYVDGTSSHNKWLDTQYNEYKQLCIKNCEEIKSKKEFELIALTLKDTKTDKIKLANILEKTTNEVTNVKKTILEVANINVEEQLSKLLKPFEDTTNKIAAIELTEPLTSSQLDKKHIFLNWIEDNNICLSDTESNKIEDIYDHYILYILSTYHSNNPDYIYSNKHGVFTSALKRKFPNIIINKINNTINITL
jgi:hypothetical protein